MQVRDQTFHNPDVIQRILAVSGRIRYILTSHYEISLDDITGIRVDADNRKLDIQLPEAMYRFKVKGPSQALMRDPATGGLQMVMDPALVQGIMNIIDDFS